MTQRAGEPEAEPLEVITVKSLLPDNRVALHEVDPAHPDGEIFVYGDTPVQAARTAAVEEHLARKEVAEVAATPTATKAGEASEAKATEEKPAAKATPASKPGTGG